MSRPDHPPLGPAVLAAGARAARGDRAAQLGAGGRDRRRGRAARLRGDDAVRLRLGGRRAPVRHQRRVDQGARHPLLARRRRAQPVADRADDAAVPGRGDVAGVPPGRAAAAVHVPPRAGRDRGAGRVHRAGPGAVRPLLRPDAGAVLLPRRAVGQRAGPGVGDLQDDHLHARRLAADAGRRGRDGGAVGRRRHDHLHDLGPRAGAPRGVDAALDLHRVRARVPDQDAALPVPRVDAGRLPDDAAAGAGDLLRRALEGRRLRLPADRAAAVPGRRRRTSSR